MRMIVRILIIAAGVALYSKSSLSCSLTAGAFIQSNFEMIDAADAIVVAKAVRKKKGEYSDIIFFDVKEVIKGEPTRIVTDQSGHFGKPIPSDPTNILFANPEAFAGPCNRMTYRKGDQYVLMLDNSNEQGFIVSGDPFSRINEDYFGPDSLWRRAIDTYLRIQRNEDRMNQLVEMRELVERGSEKDAGHLERQLGVDALIHLSNIHPDKPTEWLLDRYEDPDFIARTFASIIQGTPEEEVSEITTIVFGDRSTTEDQRSKILRALSEGDHPEAAPLFEGILNEVSPEPTRLGSALAFYIRNDEYELVKKSFGQHILWIEAVTGPGRGPGFWETVSSAVGYGNRRLVPQNFGDWWDKQTLAHCLIKSGPFDCSFGWEEAAALLDDPYPNKVLILAGASSPEVVSWAEEELDRLEE
ncbi:MAG: hypothetical protein AAGH38_05475, partial [Pseudomonadota bacterium]